MLMLTKIIKKGTRCKRSFLVQSLLMKTLIRVLLLGTFAAVAVITMVGGYEFLIVLGFLLMGGLVALNYFLIHGIKTSAAAQMLDQGEEIRFSAFGSRLLSLADAGRPRAQARSERGRLLVTTRALRFFVRKESGIEETFSIPLDQIEAAGLGQVLSSPQGLIVTGKKNREAHFAVFGMGKKYPLFLQALGWKQQGA